jgi:hypothetical protein
MMLILIFLGIFVDQVSMMMITLPIFMPVVQALGIDLIWFGVLFLICMQLGLLLMTMKGVAPPQVTMLHIFQAVVPFVVMSVLLLTLVFVVPSVATWLPSLVGSASGCCAARRAPSRLDAAGCNPSCNTARLAMPAALRARGGKVAVVPLRRAVRRRRCQS